MHQHILRTTDDSEFVGLALSLHMLTEGFALQGMVKNWGFLAQGPVVSMLYVCSVPCSVDTELKHVKTILVLAFDVFQFLQVGF